jgi:hypothetical protein
LATDSSYATAFWLWVWLSTALWLWLCTVLWLLVAIVCIFFFALFGQLGSCAAKESTPL